MTKQQYQSIKLGDKLVTKREIGSTQTVSCPKGHKVTVVKMYKAADTGIAKFIEVSWLPEDGEIPFVYFCSKGDFE